MGTLLFVIIIFINLPGKTAPSVSCGDPEGIAHGSRKYNTFNVGGIVSYSCDPCFILQGRKNITCRSDKSWSHAPPSCIAATCPPIKIGKTTLPSKTFNGSHEFTCAYSNVMIGSPVMTCQCNGTWSSEPPICIHSDDRTTTRTMNKRLTTTTTYPTLIGSNLTTTSSTPLQIVKCTFPSVIANGDMYFIYKKQGLVSDIFFPGSVIMYSCKYGYHMKGRSIRFCQPDGKWNADSPLCVKDAKACPNPPILKHGKYVGSNKVGDTLETFCNEAYDVEGKKKVSCKRDGSYSNEPAICVAKCSKLKCKDYEECIYDRKIRKAVCKCKSPFSCRYIYKPICASDGKFYNNECIMKVKTCKQGKLRRKVADGFCKTGLSCQKIPRDNCRASIPMIYYNKEKRKCEKINGCTGRGFIGYKTIDECKQECDGLCKDKAVKGPCDLNQTRWTYDTTTSQCDTFTYGGCFGSSNMFMTKNDCELLCQQKL